MKMMDGFACTLMDMRGDMREGVDMSRACAMVKGWLCKMMRGVRVMFWFSMMSCGVLDTIPK